MRKPFCNAACLRRIRQANLLWNSLDNFLRIISLDGNKSVRVTMKTIFWIAGENSGDLHAGHVMAEMNARFGKYRHVGIGGPRMREQGFHSYYPFQQFNVMGFVEVFKHLRFFLKVEKDIRRRLTDDPPDLVILVDYPGFNMRIARIADDLGIPVLWYISPQFWAWKHNRVFDLKSYTRHVACILPFEKDLLDINRVNCSYVGHPIAEEITLELNREDFARFFGLDPDKTWVGFVPGSRDMEIERLLPVYAAASRMFDHTKCQVLVSKAHSVNNKLFLDLLRLHGGDDLHVIDGHRYEMMKYCRALAVTSGTATLEAAYLGTPTVIVYKTSRISYELGKRYIRIKRIGLPNIVLEEDVLPELIQQQATPGAIYRTLLNLLEDSPERRAIERKLADIHRMLGEKQASKEVANLAENLLESRMYVSL